MRFHFLIIIYLAIIGFAFLSNHEHNKTRKSISTAEKLRKQIDTAKEDYDYLVAEWNYLNRPDRIAALADRFYDQLQLVPVSARFFGDINLIPLRNNTKIQLDQTSNLLIAVPVSWVKVE